MAHRLAFGNRPAARGLWPVNTLFHVGTAVALVALVAANALIACTQTLWFCTLAVHSGFGASASAGASAGTSAGDSTGASVGAGDSAGASVGAGDSAGASVGAGVNRFQAVT